MAQLPTKLPFSKKRLAPRIVISYILDYVFIIAFAIGFWELDLIEPFHQHFSLDNKSLQYPYAVKERITIQEAILISLLAPLVIIIFFTLVLDGLFSHHKPSSLSPSTSDGVSGRRRRRRKLRGPYRFKDRLWEMNCGILGLFLAQAMAFVITQILKNACGKPRPDLIDRCQPAPGSHDAPIYGLSNSTICQGDPKLIKDGFRSWPSGHSSSSFAGLFYLSLYLSGKMHIMDKRGEVWKTIIVIVPCVAASLIAVSRIMDARHHPFDVITGSLLGILSAWIAYRQYFPSLSEPWKKGRAYPIRSWGTEPAIPPQAVYNDHEDALPLRNDADGVAGGEPIYAQGQQLATHSSQQISGQSVLQQQQSLAAAVGSNTRRDRDSYSSSSSEDEPVGYEMTAPRDRRRPNFASPPPAVAYQPYDTTYHSSNHLDSPPNVVVESGIGIGQRQLAGEV
ncbi:hypothetical protein UA08_08275 [Talaromyces atroroseus]|uniref:Phosphatidic acid phosphatase type 2/haloperoxidase domain-containing protein n=1 Tax=Talaromyces atroroseus TaxID=1441469 RepID=A0A225A8T5_TALAT|nr:hypothetical protein UA08_08275 [Talaromyces atroroseus]OKL56370.1 hypothetical protein UA08_08275 [Talaromyces atroroseus]